MENSGIADTLDRIADLLEIRDANPFKIRSYRNAARTVRDLPERIEYKAENKSTLKELPGIGESIAEQIREIVQTGHSKKLDAITQDIPVGVCDIMDVPGVGSKKAKQLYTVLDIRSLDDLRDAVKQHKIRDLKGMGKQTEENIRRGIQTISNLSGRMLINDAMQHCIGIWKYLDSLETVNKFRAAGSLRRRKETIGDLDFILLSENREQTSKGLIQYPEVRDVIGRGKEKVSVRLESGIQVDFRFFDDKSFGAALLYFTGSKSHNIALRSLAQEKEYKINEYGLFEGKKRLAGKHESDVYKQLGLSYIPPELREDRGEIDAAADHDLPELVAEDDIRGELHSHTNKTDGADTLKDMAEAARKRGQEYIAVTNHSQAVSVTSGLTDSQVGEYHKKLRTYAQNHEKPTIISGIEVDILEDGSLDLSSKTLEMLDWVTASIHSHFDQDEQQTTERYVRAIESGLVDCISHPLGRQIGKRDPLRMNFERVLEACLENRVALEINSYPNRLDLPDVYCRRAKEAGVKIAVTTDAHKTSDLDFMKYGVHTARRGWLEKADVLNTKTAKQLMQYLRK